MAIYQVFSQTLSLYPQATRETLVIIIPLIERGKIEAQRGPRSHQAVNAEPDPRLFPECCTLQDAEQPGSPALNRPDSDWSLSVEGAAVRRQTCQLLRDAT